MSFTDQELLTMLRDLESDRVERKASLSGDAPEKVREAVCAYANDLPGHQLPGVIFVGVMDDGRPSGLPITDRLLLSLSDVKTDGNILPPPTIVVEKRTLAGVDVAVVTVLPADSPPVRFKGRIWVRVGPRRALASAQDERLLNEKRRAHGSPFDVQSVATASIGDLDRRTFEQEYLPLAVSPEILEANGRSYEEKLAGAKMIVSADLRTPTVLGLLTLGFHTTDFIPGAYVQFLRVDGDTLADPIIDEQNIQGAILDVVRRVEEKVEAHIRTMVSPVESILEVRRPDYPLTALRQLVRNALLHRTYEGTNSPVRLVWYRDRIEITNPGGPFGIVNQQNFGTPGVTDYRNPNLAEAMRVIGLVQRFGAGLPIATSELKKNGNPPMEFQLDRNIVGVIVRCRP